MDEVKGHFSTQRTTKYLLKQDLVLIRLGGISQSLTYP